MKLEKRKAEDLIPYENNAKLHPRYQIEEIKESIKQFGFCDPIGISKDNIIIEGHGRWQALKELGIKECEVIVLDHIKQVKREMANEPRYSKKQRLNKYKQKLEVELREVVRRG